MDAWARLGGQRVHAGAEGTGILKSPLAQASTFFLSSYKCREEKNERERKKEDQGREEGQPCGRLAPGTGAPGVARPIHLPLRLTF